MTASVAGALVEGERRTPGPSGALLGAHAHTRQDVRPTDPRSSGASGQGREHLVDLSAFVLWGTESRRGRGEHAPLPDVLQEVALWPADGDELQAVMPGLPLGQRARAGPLDAPQVGVGDHQARARDVPGVAPLDDVIDHALRVLA